MRGFSTIAFVAAILSVSTGAIQLHKRTDGPARVVALPIEKKDVTNPLLRDRMRQRNTQQVTLENLATFYSANGSLGTPAQSVRIHLDTGSSDLWVNTPSSALCSGNQNPCRLGGTYSANESSTYQYVASDFNISYGDGTTASGDYVSDTFTIGQTKLDRLQFGIGYSSSTSDAILGIGYGINEAQVGKAGKQPYQNLPAKMVAESLISSNAYSIWLNDLDASTGSILFGGVDTDQFTGTLNTLPIQQTQGFFTDFLITLTALSFGSTTIASGQAQAVLLDTGSSLTYLPNAMAEAIYQIVGAQYDNTQSAAYVPCSLVSNGSTLDFIFSGPKISVDMTELVIEVGDSRGNQASFSDGTPACLFGIAPAGDGISILGDTFLRSAYVVYDLSNNEISIAQTKFNVTSTNVLEIGTGTNSVPDTTDVANPVAASNAVSGGGRVGGPTAAATSKSAAQKTAPPGALGAMAALGVGMVYAAT